MRAFLFIALLFLTFSGWGQSAISGSVLPNLPASVKWQQIKSPHFRVIFTEGFEKEAQRATNILESVYEPGSRTLGASPRRFPVILQNQHTTSNGFVTIGPYRSELFTLAPQGYQFLGNDHWMEKLIAHEYRHMVQFEKSLSGFTKTFYYLFGEYTASVWPGIAAPSWFFEGDAVGLETAMGRTGRGRVPSFLMSFKANTMEKGGFHYYKQHLNSFRDFVPNHYVTGYLMTTHLKNKYGPHIWDDITQNAFSKPFIPFTFSNSIKKHTGKYLVPTYDEMLEEQKQLFSQQLSSFEPTPFDIINKESKEVYVNYRFPKPLSDGSVFCIKSGFGDISQFVIIRPDGQEKSIHTLGPYISSEFLSANDSVVVWIESTFDPRWDRRTYSDIKKLNFRTGQLSRLSKKERYTSVATSSDGKLLVATHQSITSEYSIYLLDGNTGDMIRRFDNPENHFYSMPVISPDGKSIISLKHVGDGKQIVQIDVETSQEKVLYTSQDENIGHPVMHGGHLYFNSTFNGIDNIYALDLKSQKEYLVTQAKYGAFNPALTTDGQILYNDFFVDGMNAVQTSVSPDLWIPKEEVKYIGTRFEETMVENEDISDELYNTSSVKYDIKKYNRTARSLRPVSWGLAVLPTSEASSANDISVGLVSMDLLSTTRMQGVLTYNTAENAWRYGFDVSYQALYPILDLGGDFGNRAAILRDTTGVPTQYYWDENTWTAGFRVPLTLTNSKYHRGLVFGSKLEISKVENYTASRVGFEQSGNGTLRSIKSSMRFSRLLKRSKLDIRPKWGQVVELHYYDTPFGGNSTSALFGTEGLFYLPGLFKHHSFYLRGSYQAQDIENYAFKSPVAYTRGYGYTAYDEYANLGINYTLPIAYMDWHLGPLINLQRIYGNAFYDYGFGQSMNKNDRLNSFGAEVSFNFNLMRYLLLFDVGIRYGYLPENGSDFKEIVIGPILF